MKYNLVLEKRKVFAQPFHNIKPDIICMAKGMGNGFPIGGILFLILKLWIVRTFGGSHLACAASIAVLDVIEEQNLSQCK
jgi:acetylornithine aminotransferase